MDDSSQVDETPAADAAPDAAAAPETPAKPEAEPPASSSRNLALDAARGVAIVLMAVDHCSAFAKLNLLAESYVHRHGELAATPWFLLGLLTNVSAVLFWFVAGISIMLLAERERRRSGSHAPAVRYLFVRASLLLLFDLVAMPVMWADWHDFHLAYSFELLSSLAVSMLIATALLPLPAWGIASFAALAAAAFPFVVAVARPGGIPNDPLLVRMWTTFGPAHGPRVAFPVLGWLPLMLLGLAVGRRLQAGGWRRPRTWALAGAGLLAATAVVRVTGFGDYSTLPASGWPGVLLMSKGPPGLDYLCFNLALGFFTLAWFLRDGERFDRAPQRWLVTFGQASLFFFMVHLLVIRAIEVPLRHLMPGSAPGRYVLGLALALPVMLALSRAYRRMKVAHPRSVLHYL